MSDPTSEINISQTLEQARNHTIALLQEKF